MEKQDIEARALELAEKAKSLTVSGDGEKATQALREALALAPGNEHVKKLAQDIQRDEDSQPLLKMCQKFTTDGNVLAGKDAVRYLAGAEAKSTSVRTAEDVLRMLIDAETADVHIRDEIVAGLIQQCAGARRSVAKQLEASATAMFTTLYYIGDGAANGITAVSLDKLAWVDESVRRRCEKDVFLLFLAKLLESGHDHDGRALKGISRHLATDAEGLHTEVDQQSFEAILVCLDYRLSEEVRGQAMLATAKYLEAAKKTGEDHLTKFITTRTAKHSSEDLVAAFSVAAAVFPIATPLISTLFLVEGFLPSLVPLLDKKSRPIKVEKAALDMLSAACIDAGCRDAIAKYCWDWMHHVMDDEDDERHGQAALILAKVQSQPTKSTEPNAGHPRRARDIQEVVPRLKEMFMKGTEIDQRTGIEGLAYASVQASVKEELVKDAFFMKRLFQQPKKDSMSSTTAFGFLTLIDNLTRYLAVLSEEQRKMSELKAYANASKPQSQPDKIDEDVAVTQRCKKCLDAGVVSFLVTLKSASVSHPLSSTCLGLIAKVLLSLSKPSIYRGTLAQQGAIPLLLQIRATSGVPDSVKFGCAHALARILISTNPSLIPRYTVACVHSSMSLLKAGADFTDDQPRNLLPTFEAVLALTNLVSDPSLQTGAVVVQSYDEIEDLVLSSNKLVQRAAVELVCNLSQFPEGLEKLADGSPGAAKRLNILLALADAEDVATRRAAGGALAGALAFPDAIHAVLERDGGLKRLLELCQDEDEGCAHRGVACLEAMLSSEDGDTDAKQALVAGNAAEVVAMAAQRWKTNSALLETAMAVIQHLKG